MSGMTTVDLDRLLALRRQYPMRGPRDGRTGLTPEGRIGPPPAWPVEAVLADAEEALVCTANPTDLVRWRAAMGLEDPPAPPDPTPARDRWAEQCPGRGAGLGHAHWSRCRGSHPGTGERHPAGTCCHCGGRP